MMGRKFRVPEDMLPFAARLSVEEQKKWAYEWRRLVWHSPRCIVVFLVSAATVAAFFAVFMPGWQIVDPVGSKIFCAVELFLAYVAGENAAFVVSKGTIKQRIQESLHEAKASPLRETYARRGSLNR
jgi:hypothetical protein